jgi:hypothetical protein
MNFIFFIYLEWSIIYTRISLILYLKMMNINCFFVSELLLLHISTIPVSMIKIRNDRIYLNVYVTLYR